MKTMAPDQGAPDLSDYWDEIIHNLGYIKGALGQGLLYEDNGNSRIIGFIAID